MGIPSVTIPPARSAFNHTDLAGAEKESLRTLSPAAVPRTNSRPYEARSRPVGEDPQRRQVHHDVADRGAGRAGQRQRHRRRRAVLRVRPPLQEVSAGHLVAGRSRVIALTMFDLHEYAHSALRAGASGFLLKDALPGSAS
jgi:hypothetical protein